MSKIIEIVSKDLAGYAPQAARRSMSADQYWSTIAARAVTTTLSQIKDADELALTLKAASDYNRQFSSSRNVPLDEFCKLIGITAIVEREPRPARRKRTKTSQAPAAKRALARRKRKR